MDKPTKHVKLLIFILDKLMQNKSKNNEAYESLPSKLRYEVNARIGKHGSVSKFAL